MSGADDGLPFEHLLNATDDGVFLLEADGTIAWTNEPFAELLDDGEDPSGRPFTSLLEPGSGEPDLDALAAGDAAERVTLETNGGTAVECAVSVQALDTGQYGGRLRDVPERRESERRLERCRTVLDTVEDAIYVTDSDRRFTWVNEATERMFGYDRDEIRGRHLFEFLDEDQVAVAEQNAECLLSEAQPDVVTFEMDVRRRDGTEFPAETRATLLPGEGFAGTVGIIRDVSDRKARTRELERKNDRLESFADTITHDVRNPLNVAVSRLDLAMRECESDDLRAVEDALERIRDIVDRLYAIAKHGEQVGPTDPTDVASLASDAWSMVPTADATLDVDEDVTVDADGTRLQQALENLFRNAVEHAGPSVAVTVGALDDAEGFYVADDGPGIPEDRRQHVFEEGYTVDQDGTGFGLNIVEDVAAAHGWAVRLGESADGGARFEFETDPGRSA